MSRPDLGCFFLICLISCLVCIPPADADERQSAFDIQAGDTTAPLLAGTMLPNAATRGQATGTQTQAMTPVQASTKIPSKTTPSPKFSPATSATTIGRTTIRTTPSTITSTSTTTRTTTQPATTTTKPTTTATTTAPTTTATGTVSQTSALSMGVTQSGSIMAAGEVHEYTVTVSSGDLLFVRCVNSGDVSAFTPKAWIYGPQGDQKVKGIDGDGTVWKADAAGTCRIQVLDDWDGKKTGTYALYVQLLSRPENAISASIGSVISGSLAVPGEVDAYTIEAGAGDRCVIGMEKLSGDLWPEVSIFSANGETVIHQSSGSQILFTVQFPSAGTYTLLADDGFRDTYTGAYALYLQRVNRPVGATLLPRGSLVVGRVVNPGELITYAFEAAANEEVTFRAEQTDGDLWPMIWLFSPSGEELGKEYGGIDCSMTRRLAAGGTHTLLVGNGFGGSPFTGSFALSAGMVGSPTLTYVAETTTVRTGNQFTPLQTAQTPPGVADTATIRTTKRTTVATTVATTQPQVTITRTVAPSPTSDPGSEGSGNLLVILISGALGVGVAAIVLKGRSTTKTPEEAMNETTPAPTLKTTTISPWHEDRRRK